MSAGENACAVVNKLIAREMHIAFAESCTGGLAASALVSVPNASRVLEESYVTDSERAKCAILEVPEQLIDSFGVVSEPVAAAMASGVARRAGAEVGVGITGIAGPSGGTEETPVGTVCFGFSVDGAVCTWTCHFENAERDAVREMSVDFVFNALNALL